MVRRLRGVIERFTDSARLVVAASVEEAASLGHSLVGTEHLLLGMLREPAGPAFGALTAAGVTLEAARARVIDVEGSVDAVARNERASFTTGVRQLMEQSLRDAVGFPEHDIVGRGADATPVRNVARLRSRKLVGAEGSRLWGSHSTVFESST